MLINIVAHQNNTCWSTENSVIYPTEDRLLAKVALISNSSIVYHEIFVRASVKFFPGPIRLFSVCFCVWHMRVAGPSLLWKLLQTLQPLCLLLIECYQTCTAKFLQILLAPISSYVHISAWPNWCFLDVKARWKAKQEIKTVSRWDFYKRSKQTNAKRRYCYSIFSQFSELHFFFLSREMCL